MIENEHRAHDKHDDEQRVRHLHRDDVDLGSEEEVVLGTYARSGTDAANRLEYAVAVSVIQFASKIFDMDINYVAKGFVVEIPQVCKKVFPIYNLALMPQEIFQQTELLEGKRDRFPAKRDRMVASIEFYVAAAQHFRQKPLGPAQERLKAGQQSSNANGLNEIVVRPRQKKLHLRIRFGPRGKDKNREYNSPCARFPADGIAI